MIYDATCQPQCIVSRRTRTHIHRHVGQTKEGEFRCGGDKWPQNEPVTYWESVIATVCVAECRCVCYVHVRNWCIRGLNVQAAHGAYLAASHLSHPTRPPHLIHSLVYCRGGIWVINIADARPIEKLAIKNALCWFAPTNLTESELFLMSWGLYALRVASVSAHSLWELAKRGSKICYLLEGHQQDADLVSYAPNLEPKQPNKILYLIKT